jgi:hypothetical protein
MNRRALLFAISVMVAPALPAQAPLKVFVESSGAPVAEATIELWTSTARVALRVADREGSATFTAAEVRAATTLLARRVGFAPGRVSVDALLPEIRIALERLAAPLAEVTVREAEQACPAREDSRARALWEAARTRYVAPDKEHRKSWFSYQTGTVRSAELGLVDRARLQYRGVRQADRGVLAAEDARVARQGYVWPLEGSHTSEQFGIWKYPTLQHFHAEHFAEDVFGSLQTLSFAKDGADEDASVLVFCGRDRKRSGIDGTIKLGADSSFLVARWRYWNPARDAEKAGGEVVFTPFDRRSFTPWLHAAQGLYWRELRGGMYWHRWEEYEGWELWVRDSARTGARPPR